TSFTLDNTVPAALTMALESDTGSSDSDGITKNGAVTVSGLEANATWKYSKDGGTTWADGTGTSFTLAEGTYAANAIQVKQFDAAGNESDVTKMAATVDKTAPAFSSADTGTAIVGQSIEVYDAEVTGGDTGITYTISGTDAGKYKIGSVDGKITYDGTPTAKTATPDMVIITAEDVAGNTSTKNVSISVVDKPVGSSSIEGATNMDVRSPIVLTFSEIVTVNSGFKITLTDTNDSDNDASNGIDGVGWKNDKTQNNQEILLTSDMVSIRNDNGKSIVTINPAKDLDFGTSYKISIDADAFTGTVSNQKSLAVDMSFETVTPKTDTTGTESKIQVAGVDALASSNWWVDGHQGKTTGRLIKVIAGQDAVKDADGNLSGLDKDVALAVSLNSVGGTLENGYTGLIGLTDKKDILYMDIDNVLTFGGVPPDSYLTVRNWQYMVDEDALDPVYNTRGIGKITANLAAAEAVKVGFLSIPEPENTYIGSDDALHRTDYGAILYG
ncbi:MAG: hypothetical protein FE834_05585, partial [Gammaproteobacteria bacterium]|nr:hypothetical protein [Gammaproteobacteria bacterium]